MPFIPTPENLKMYTDKIQDLLDEINSVQVDEERLKPKENQIIDEVSVLIVTLQKHSKNVRLITLSSSDEAS